MGVNLSDIVPIDIVQLEDLAGKSIAIDAYNAIYQFLSVIRQPDGTPLMDAKGRVTSHLAGLLYRNTNLIEAGIRPSYVFDGIPPEMKKETILERSEKRAKAKAEWEDALRKGDYEKAFSKATRASRITNEIVESSRILLTYLGVPVVQAPEEGEAQAAYMASKGDVWAASSQDFDSLLFGAPRLVRNLTLTGKRKMPGRSDYKTVSIEVIELNKTLSQLELTREQLIDLCILMGTDYNAGVSGIGPKKALKLIHEHGNIDSALKDIGVEIPRLEGVRYLFLDYEKTDEYVLDWKAPEKGKVIEFLCEQHDFSKSRVEGALSRIEERQKTERAQTRAQSSLDVFG
ncbi:MAG: flap endonuclease-1 [Methanomassiliicoccales archaeon]|nr:flap endonuclease-1 [Methanomassiliicoccales archaeon]